MLAFTVCLFYVFVAVAAQRSGDVVTLVKCPDECSSDYGAVFRACTNTGILAGCTIKPCAHGIQCVPPAVPAAGTEIKPGGKIAFEKARLYQDVKFFVKFTGSETATDLYLLSDGTGSMAAAIRNVKEKFAGLIRSLNKFDDLHAGVGVFRDEGDAGHDGGFINLQGITADESAALRAVNKLEARGGGDNPEANLVALYKIATDSSINWRANSRKIVAYFGDQPGHEKTCYKGKELFRHDMIDALQAKNITAVAVNFGYGLYFGGKGMDSKTSGYRCDGSYDYTPGSPNQATDIAVMTGGSIVPSNDQEQLVELIETVAMDLPKNYYAEYPSCAGYLDIKFAPELPISPKSGEQKTILQTVTVQDRVCADLDGKTFTCSVDWIVGGYKFPTTSIEILDIEGCVPYALK